MGYGLGKSPIDERVKTSVSSKTEATPVMDIFVCKMQKATQLSVADAPMKKSKNIVLPPLRAFLGHPVQTYGNSPVAGRVKRFLIEIKIYFLCSRRFYLYYIKFF